LFTLQPGAERSDVVVLKLLERKPWRIRIDVLTPVRLHQIPLLCDFLKVFTFLDH
jgi:hypothetical protein